MHFSQFQTLGIIDAMPDNTDKHPLNVPGRYYNDLTCIDCDQCREIAPRVFARDDEDGSTYVFHQPENTAEIALAEVALTACPTESIGNDGEPSALPSS